MPAAWIALSLGSAMGAALGRLFAGAARLLAPQAGAEPDRGWRDPATLVGACIPVAAALYAPGPAAALAVTGIGWLLLAIAVCDERTLRIPHVLWIVGIGVGLVVAWSVAGWRGIGARILCAAAMDGALLLCAGAAQLLWRRAVLGPADYGVVAFVSAVCGLGATVDVLLLGGVIALASVVERQASPGRRAAAATSLAAVLAAALLGTGGAAAGATILTVLAVRGSRRGRPPSPAPFGSCLAAATILVVLGAGVWPRSASSAFQHDIVLHRLHPDRP
jgi:hypothetical protein